MGGPLSDHHDAFGRALYDHLHGRGGHEIIERSDGYIDVASSDLTAYFQSFAEWPAHERQAARHLHGRVLDIGCGAGRVALHAQAQGLAAVGIDISPLALEVCRSRGVAQLYLRSIAEVDRSLGEFDTLVLMGNNFGLFGNERRARQLLRRFYGLTPAQGRIIAEVIDPYPTEEPFHHAYHEANREKGRLSGQLRLRVRYKRHRTPWFDYLFVSKQEMEQIVAGTGWRVAEVIESGGAAYIGVLEKT
jgi:SAM-dependent methyltransferase